LIAENNTDKKHNEKRIVISNIGENTYNHDHTITLVNFNTKNNINNATSGHIAILIS
jgi:hypothetical protein